MGKTNRQDSDYPGKPEFRIPRADKVVAQRADADYILSTFGAVALPLRQELSLVPEIIDSFRDHLLGGRALGQEIELSA